MINFNFFLKSALTTLNCLHTIPNVIKWLENKKNETFVQIELIDFKEMKDWIFNKDNGYLMHKSGSFFSIQGINVKTNWGSIPEWEQPIINQPEIGYLGIITKEFEGTLYFLLQAKIEPGNINLVQLSPTLQATKSNYELKHHGKKPLYLNYFQNAKNEQILLNQLQSEQGARFLKKRNRNIIIKIDEKIEVAENFIWLTLGQIKELLKFDNIINMDTRTVISGIPFYFDEIENLKHLLPKENTYNFTMIQSTFTSNESLHSFDIILNWVTKLKCAFELEITPKSLKTLNNWIITENKIKHVNELYFKIIATNVTINNREVAQWNQPLVLPLQHGVFAFIIAKIKDVYHFLVQGKVEPGNFDIIEMAPTVQCITGSYNDYSDVPFLKEVMQASHDQIRYDTLQSEEGGRFYQEQNRNMIIEIDEFSSVDLPENYIWISLNQLTFFLKFNNYLNIQTRSLISSIQFI